ncbi:hypothetical protein C8A03DRAFT_43114 [Achaetomium macrosporum]|uniref:protein-tyrosine-phosphatase n=1 Tax=Achaetomium macrosporum TaxID=79813 RepID=A0AAN7CC48_9PEZI|nr:hypothetical protein C8A03DRAFT_43114 [Achaetomium macrosporum]
MPPEPRITDRPSYYTMKTSGPVPAVSPQGLTHSRTPSQSYINTKPTTTSPLASPKPPHSVMNQPHPPPKLSPPTSRGSPQDGRAPSPNYFGLAVDSATADPRDSARVPRENWSLPSSSVKSFAAALPKQLPLDANPEFEAFRKQVDANRARAGFTLSHSNFNIISGGAHNPSASTPSALQRPRAPKWPIQGSDGSDFPFAQSPRLAAASLGLRDAPASKTDRDGDGLHGDSAYVSGDSGRSSTVSLDPAASHLISPPKPQPPFPVADEGGVTPGVSRTVGRPSPQLLARSKTGSPFPVSSQQAGAVGVSQIPGAGGSIMLSPTELKELLERDEKDQATKLLLLDLRVSPQFAQARVRGALNLCIPTTLLKRATFNLQKLQQTFQADRDQDRFSKWREATHLVVYDASSDNQRDATSALNMIKKFTNEGYSGPARILRGGFNAFAAAYPSLVDISPLSAGGPSPGLSLGGSSAARSLHANLPPVFGGVVLPNASDNPSPFFNNIRQNQDLVDGVGQMEIGVPSGLVQDSLPRWLREASEASDRGKKVSEKFLRIELTEQARMREAYSIVKSAVSGRTAEEDVTRVQLSGIEKGGKNRYKDILPFEHARVRLLGRPEGACDYINASHLRANRTYKRYIASQGPLPATFEDFWSVVWDNDVRVIVMLTAESEGGQLKCHPYWKAMDYGAIKLRVLSEKKISLDIDRRRDPLNAAAAEGSTSSTHTSTTASDALPPEAVRKRAHTMTTLDTGTAHSSNPFDHFASQAAPAAETPFVIIRKFALSHAAHPFTPIREITQLHYPSWPDFGAPAQPSHLLALVELANAMQRASLPLSTSVSRKNSIGTSDDAATSDGTTHNAAGLTRAESDTSSLPLSWYDGPESSENSRPMLVHCSAGCGRTGAFCTVDSVIDMLKRQRLHMLHKHSGGSGAAGPRRPSQSDASRKAAPPSECDAEGDIIMDGVGATAGAGSARNKPGIDTSWLDDDSIDLIAHTVEDFRGQRLSMVQSLRQFVLCYETVLEWIRRLQESGAVGVDARATRARSGSLSFV